MIRGDLNRDSELVIGIVHTVGTVSSEIIECMIDSLNKFHYKSEIIKVSKEILSPFASVPPNFTDEHERISFFMDKGNEIRKKTGDDAILMKGVCAFIYGKYRLGRNEGPQLRKAYIIDSIKHPDEVEFLRRTYGDGFHLVGISDDYERRKSYLMDRKNLSEQQAIDILNRDDNEKEKNGQHTRDAYQQADYFINAGDIEPYPKSKALDFYKIEISQDRKDIRKKVVFMPFKGVGPHRFVDLFSMQSIRWYARTRKQTNGYVVDWERNTANLRNPMGLLNYIDMEKSAYNQYAEEITGIGKEDENEYEKNSKA